MYQSVGFVPVGLCTILRRLRTGVKRTPSIPISRVDYDPELRVHNALLRRSYGIGSGDRVLDIGCGTGQTTRDAARLAAAGNVLGVDVSAPMIERARRLTRAARLRNVEFERADATERILETAGFAEAGFTPVHAPVYYGRDVAAALDWVQGAAGDGRGTPPSGCQLNQERLGAGRQGAVRRHVLPTKGTSIALGWRRLRGHQKSAPVSAAPCQRCNRPSRPRPTC